MNVLDYLALTKREAVRHVAACTSDDSDLDKRCVGASLEFVKAYLQARLGDVHAEEDVAFYLSRAASDAMGGGVEPDPVESCAWWIMIIYSPDATFADRVRMSIECNPLDSDDRKAALTKAKQMTAEALEPTSTLLDPSKP